MTSFYKLMSTSSHPIDSGKYVDNIKIGKKKVVKVVNALEKLKQLQTLQFRYKEEFNPDQRLRAGFSAQQVQKVIPEAVVEENGILMLDMHVLREYRDKAEEELKAKNS